MGVLKLIVMCISFLVLCYGTRGQQVNSGNIIEIRIRRCAQTDYKSNQLKLKLNKIFPKTKSYVTVTKPSKACQSVQSSPLSLHSNHNYDKKGKVFPRNHNILKEINLAVNQNEKTKGCLNIVRDFDNFNKVIENKIVVDKPTAIIDSSEHGGDTIFIETEIENEKELGKILSQKETKIAKAQKLPDTTESNDEVEYFEDEYDNFDTIVSSPDISQQEKIIDLVNIHNSTGIVLKHASNNNGTPPEGKTFIEKYTDKTESTHTPQSGKAIVTILENKLDSTKNTLKPKVTAISDDESVVATEKDDIKSAVEDPIIISNKNKESKLLASKAEKIMSTGVISSNDYLNPKNMNNKCKQNLERLTSENTNTEPNDEIIIQKNNYEELYETFPDSKLVFAELWPPYQWNNQNLYVPPILQYDKIAVSPSYSYINNSQGPYLYGRYKYPNLYVIKICDGFNGRNCYHNNYKQISYMAYVYANWNKRAYNGNIINRASDNVIWHKHYNNLNIRNDKERIWRKWINTRTVLKPKQCLIIKSNLS